MFPRSLHSGMREFRHPPAMLHQPALHPHYGCTRDPQFDQLVSESGLPPQAQVVHFPCQTAITLIEKTHPDNTGASESDSKSVSYSSNGIPSTLPQSKLHQQNQDERVLYASRCSRSPVEISQVPGSKISFASLVDFGSTFLGPLRGDDVVWFLSGLHGLPMLQHLQHLQLTKQHAQQ